MASFFIIDSNLIKLQNYEIYINHTCKIYNGSMQIRLVNFVVGIVDSFLPELLKKFKTYEVLQELKLIGAGGMNGPLSPKKTQITN